MRDWEDSYQTGHTPWDTGIVDPILAQAVKANLLQTGRLLEIGCGTGTHARYLAHLGWTVTAIDISPKAISLAQSLSPQSTIHYQTLDFLEQDLPGIVFDAVVDRGCFHVYQDLATRQHFAAKVASVLHPRGRWLSLMGSTEGPPRDFGPPRLSAADVINSVEPSLAIVSIQKTQFTIVDNDVSAWLGVFEKREGPPQPSTSF